MNNLDTIAKEIHEFSCYLYSLQEMFEKTHNDEELIYQAVRVRQRISALLSIYSQMICENRKFDEDYLKKYLGE